MADRKLLAGHAIRRLRRSAGLTQAAMSEILSISPSYLNLVERNQRPISATLLIKLAESFDFDPRALAAGEPGGGADAIRRRLADPMFADLEIDRTEVEEWLASAPGGAAAFARVFDRIGGGTAVESGDDPVTLVRREIERWRNHFADLDATAEALADELRLGAGDLYGAIAERLRAKHGLTIRVLPADVLPDMLRRLDLHARQLQLSEMLDPASRTFAVAFQLGQIEAKSEIDALAKGAGFTDRAAERLYRRHLLRAVPARVRDDRVRYRAAAAPVRCRLRTGRAPVDDAATSRRARAPVLHDPDRPRGAGIEALSRRKRRGAGRGGRTLSAVAVASRIRPAGHPDGPARRTGGRRALADDGADGDAAGQSLWRGPCRVCDRPGRGGIASRRTGGGERFRSGGEGHADRPWLPRLFPQ
jgi:transcriptional regulator with XRE-family HTH domain